MKQLRTLSIGSTVIRRIGVRQRYRNDCGPAALATVMRYFDIPMSVGRARSLCGPRNSCVSLDDLFRIAHTAGLGPQAFELSYEEIANLEFPSIVVLDGTASSGHYVVAWNVTPAGVEIWDPAFGSRTMPAEEMRCRWVPSYALCFRTQQRGAELRRTDMEAPGIVI